MSLAGIRDAIKTALETISGLKGYDTAPETPNEFPCAYVVPRSGNYTDSLGSGSLLQFEIVLLVAKGPGLGRAQDSLDGYLAPSGATSIKAALEAGDYGAHGTGPMCTGFRDYGALQYGENDNVYLGCKFDFQISAS